MQLYWYLFVVFLAIERAAAAENATTSATPTTAAQKFTIADAKNKRQINHFVRNAGANPATNDDENEPIDRIQAQSYPLQLTHAIYSQQPIYARRTTVKPEPQVVDEEQELERQQNEQQSQPIQSTYYNYGQVQQSDSNDGDTAQQIDSRHLPIEARNKPQSSANNYPTTLGPRYRSAFTPVTPKQLAAPNNPTQTLLNDDEYLDLIRSADLSKNFNPTPSTRQPAYAFYTATQPTPSEYTQTQKSPFNLEYRKFTPSPQIGSSTTADHHAAQQSVGQSQFVGKDGFSQYIGHQNQQPGQFVAQQVQYFTSGSNGPSGASHDYSSNNEKNTPFNAAKKYQKFDPSNGQYHHEVKPTKKYVTYKPPYQYQQEYNPQTAAASQQTHQTQPLSVQPLGVHNQQSAQPLYYQSVHQFSQQDSKSGEPLHVYGPESQYSIVLPQNGRNPLTTFYASEHSNQPYQSDYSNQGFSSFTNDRNVPNPYGGSTGSLAAPAALTNENKAYAQPIQYVQFGTQTPTPAPGRPKFVENEQQLKYELYDGQGNTANVAKEKPNIKLLSAPHNVHRPQYSDHPAYYKKVKLPVQHSHQAPTRYHQPTPQPSQATAQTQDDVLIPIQPSRSAVFVSAGTVENAPLQNGEKSQGSSSHKQPSTEQRKPPLPITSPKKPISQAEFQALLDAGYKVQAIPVPVPVPVPVYATSNKQRSSQFQRQPQPQQQQQAPPSHPSSHGHSHVAPIAAASAHPTQHHAAQHRQAPTHYIRYHPQHESEEGIFTSYLRPLIDYIGGPAKE